MSCAYPLILPEGFLGPVDKLRKRRYSVFELGTHPKTEVVAMSIDTAPPSNVPNPVLSAEKPDVPAWAAKDPLLMQYFQTEWGNGVRDEHELFERLSLEVFQTGLTWLLILRKRPALREAFANFDIDEVAQFGEPEVERLLANEAIIRNQRKIQATISNAQAAIALRDRGGLPSLIWSFECDKRTADEPTLELRATALSTALHRHGFTMVGPATMKALLESLGIGECS